MLSSCHIGVGVNRESEMDHSLAGLKPGFVLGRVDGGIYFAGCHCSVKGFCLHQ